jgi:RimJ/RimL family protein N-acetyltransferase
MSLTPPAVIEGRRARLRPLAASDVEQSVVWRNDPAVRDAQLGWPFPVTLPMEEKWYAEALSGQRQDRVTFAVETQDGKLAGFVHLTHIDWISRTANFGITIGVKELQGRGIGKDATALVVAYAFDTLNLERIWLEVPAFNERAIRLYERIGFCHEGKLRAHAFADGRRHDVLIMGLLRGDARQEPVH